jgi:DNA-binding LytR/AlgR family response regulator
MYRIKVLIVEDELIVSEEIKEILHKNHYQVVGQVDNATEALEIFQLDKPDIILMDIHIKGGMDGIALAQKFNTINPVSIIFLTAYSDENYLSKAKVVRPAAYLVKPFKEMDIVSAIEISFSNASMTANHQDDNSSSRGQWLFIKDTEKHTKIFLPDVVYLEAEGSYTTFNLKNRKILVAENLKATLAKIDNPAFMKVHRSFAVNLHEVDSFTINSVQLGEHTIPISQTYKEEFFRAMKVK